MTSICKVVITLLRIVSLCDRWLRCGVVLISCIRIVCSLGVPVLLGCFLCEEWLLAFSTHLLLQNHVDSAISFLFSMVYVSDNLSSSSWSCCSAGGSCVQNYNGVSCIKTESSSANCPLCREQQGYTHRYAELNPYPYPHGSLPLHPGVRVFPMGTRVPTHHGFTQGYALYLPSKISYKFISTSISI